MNSGTKRNTGKCIKFVSGAVLYTSIVSRVNQAVGAHVANCREGRSRGRIQRLQNPQFLWYYLRLVGTIHEKGRDQLFEEPVVISHNMAALYHATSWSSELNRSTGGLSHSSDRARLDSHAALQYMIDKRF